MHRTSLCGHSDGLHLWSMILCSDSSMIFVWARDIANGGWLGWKIPKKRWLGWNVARLLCRPLILKLIYLWTVMLEWARDIRVEVEQFDVLWSECLIAKFVGKNSPNILMFVKGFCFYIHLIHDRFYTEILLILIDDTYTPYVPKCTCRAQNLSQNKCTFRYGNT